VLQVLEITDRAVLCLNLMDEARRHGLRIDDRRLARDLGIPVVPTVARRGEGLDLLIKSVADVATGRTTGRPYRIKSQSPALRRAVDHLSELIANAYPELPNTRWLAMRLLDGDQRVAQAIQSGEFRQMQTAAQGEERRNLDLNLGVVSQ